MPPSSAFPRPTRCAAADWGMQAIEANKEELKAKYEAAKETAARVNGARSQINRIKSSLDQQRVARAMEVRGTAETVWKGRAARPPGP